MDKISKKNKIKKKIKLLKNKFKKHGIDGYIIPKNDEYFTEYPKINRLKIISNFTGSAGLAIILKNKNYLLEFCLFSRKFASKSTEKAKSTHHKKWPYMHVSMFYFFTSVILRRCSADRKIIGYEDICGSEACGRLCGEGARTWRQIRLRSSISLFESWRRYFFSRLPLTFP